jgi:hypothetical protein
MANPNDGTNVGTGEVISDEYVDPSTGQRRDSNLPPTGYKVPRSKIAVGRYGDDLGDATADQALEIHSRSARQFEEILALRGRDQGIDTFMKSSAENTGLADSRGHHIAQRGVR